MDGASLYTHISAQIVSDIDAFRYMPIFVVGGIPTSWSVVNEHEILPHFGAVTESLEEFGAGD